MIIMFVDKQQLTGLVGLLSPSHGWREGRSAQSLLDVVSAIQTAFAAASKSETPDVDERRVCLRAITSEAKLSHTEQQRIPRVCVCVCVQHLIVRLANSWSPRTPSPAHDDCCCS